jgi:hypothetical protein
MQRVDIVDSRIKSLARPHDPSPIPDAYRLLNLNDAPPSPTSSTGTPVFVTATPRSDSPSTSMGGNSLRPLVINHQIRGWQ